MNIEELIQQLLKDGTPQQLTPEQLDMLKRAGSTTDSWYSAGGTPTGSGDAWDGKFTADPTADQFGLKLNDDIAALYDSSGKFIGNDMLNKQTPTDLWKQGILASLAMYGGAHALNGGFGGGEAWLGGGEGVGGTFAGGGAVEGGAGIASMGQLPSWAPVAGEAITGSIAPLSMAELGIAAIPALPAGIQAMAGEANKTFFDKAGDFLSDPKNLLTTIGTLGSVYEGLKDDPADANNFTQTTTKKLDPRLQSIIFGADGQSGVLKDLTDWAAKYPSGQNQTMVDAQNGMRGLLMNPAVHSGYLNLGNTGLGLLNQGIAPNPWLVPNKG